MHLRRIGVASSALVLSLATVTAIAASPAHAEPPTCSGRTSDSGVGGQWNIGGHNYTIWGTWYNCAGASGSVDRVRIDVANSADGNCITIPRGSSSSVQFNRGPWLPNFPDPYYVGWYGC